MAAPKDAKEVIGADGLSRKEDFAYTLSSRLRVGSGPIPMDTTFKFITKTEIPKSSGDYFSTVHGTDIAYGNMNGGQVIFDVNQTGEKRIFFDRSFLKLRVAFIGGAQSQEGWVITNPNPATMGFPWNPAVLFKRCSFSLTDSNIAIEEMTDGVNFCHTSNYNVSTSFSRSRVEQMHSNFFTPIVEDSIEGAIALSPQTQQRTAKFLNNGVRIEREILVPLWLLFQSLTIPGDFPSQRYRLQFDFQPPGNCGEFRTISATSVPFMLVVDAKLLMIQATLLTEPMIAERDKQIANSVMIRGGVTHYDAKTWKYSGGDDTYPDASAVNMQSAIVLFPATKIQNSGFVNKYQYVCNVTRIQGRLNNDYVPETAPVYTPTNRALSTRIVADYEEACQRGSFSEGRFVETMLSANEMIPQDTAGVENARYAMHIMNWIDPSGDPRRALTPMQLDIFFSGGVPADAIIIKKCVQYFSLVGLGRASKIPF